MLNVVRKIRLSKLECYQIKDKEKQLFNFIENYLFKLKPVKLKEYHNYIMYFDYDNKCIFQYDLNYHHFGINNELFFKFIDNKFSDNYGEIINIIEDIVTKFYNIKNIKTAISNRVILNEIEKCYRLI